VSRDVQDAHDQGARARPVRTDGMSILKLIRRLARCPKP
jgi:hypothetical protein